MDLNTENLCNDPLFQLNTAIWLAQPQPELGFSVYPLFHKSNISLFSISPPLALPPDIRNKIAGRLDCQNAVKPDLIFEKKDTRSEYFVLECKRSSFGPESSTAKQARTLLIATGPIYPEILAVGKRGDFKGILCYLVGSSQNVMMETTLKKLREEIVLTVHLETGDFGCFSLNAHANSIELNFSDHIKDTLGLSLSSPVKLIDLEEDTDPRPLYFIPLDPNLDSEKSEQEFGRRILIERILSYILSRIGNTQPPKEISFSIYELLNNVTFGLYEIWEDSDAKKFLKKLVKNFMMDLQKHYDKELKKQISYNPRTGWKFKVSNTKIYEEFLKQTMKFHTDQMDLSDAAQLSFFDILDD